ncbi:hypothetical protein D9756_006308 [Leucocoprinus leucothites]|uniref:DUF6534 domain-containing protein n=1 Tax=Leucocoprinus leucothites TaxID=201217 RepID=A0A8H5D444_9AGAR|nr:hypothetical protein D9756_006308 [Leucoagaricus leucothites]
MVNVPATYGALLLGGLYASLLSGLVALQVVIYFKMYEGDRGRIKALVLVIWGLDILHTGLVWAGLWDYLIGDFGNEQEISNIYWSVSATVAVTGILTFVVHWYESLCRIEGLVAKHHAVSFRIVSSCPKKLVLGRSYSPASPLPPNICHCNDCRNVCSVPELFGLTWLPEVILILTPPLLRILNDTFPSFKANFKWVFTLGLVLSTAVDILITGSLFFLLKTSRTSDFNLNAVIDTLIRYAFETGALTTAGTIVSMIFWLAMNDNLVFMGLHFVIAKLYANSILVTLNTRKVLRHARSSTGPRENGFHFAEGRRKSVLSGMQFSSKDSSGNPLFPPIRSPKVTINIERSVHCEEDPSPI